MWLLWANMAEQEPETGCYPVFQRLSEHFPAEFAISQMMSQLNTLIHYQASDSRHFSFSGIKKDFDITCWSRHAFFSDCKSLRGSWLATQTWSHIGVLHSGKLFTLTLVEDDLFSALIKVCRIWWKIKKKKKRKRIQKRGTHNNNNNNMSRLPFIQSSNQQYKQTSALFISNSEIRSFI